MNNRFIWFLRILIIIQSLGYAAKLAAPSALNSFLLGSMGDPFVTYLDRLVQVFIWFACAILFWVGFLKVPLRSFVRRLDLSLIGLLGVWSFTAAIFSWLVNPGDPFHATDPAGHAVRYAAPLALFLLTCCPGKGQVGKIIWILRWGVAGTFIGHGLCALWLKPSFIDLVIGTMDLFIGEDLDAYSARQVFAEAALPIIAIQDFILVGLLLLPGKRIKTIALWMAIWGVVTALSRMTAYGWDFWHDLALRICNGGVPFFLWAYWKAQDSTKISS